MRCLESAGSPRPPGTARPPSPPVAAVFCLPRSRATAADAGPCNSALPFLRQCPDTGEPRGADLAQASSRPCSALNHLEAGRWCGSRGRQRPAPGQRGGRGPGEGGSSQEGGTPAPLPPACNQQETIPHRKSSQMKRMHSPQLPHFGLKDDTGHEPVLN